jgi:DNA polymerase I-like protein with 3'-5' exonuclease and polymerase domains
VKGGNSMGYKYVVMDIEATGLNRYKDKINYIGIGLAKSLDSGSLDKKIILNMYEDKDLEKFKSLVQKMKKYKLKTIWQNGKFDTLFIAHHYGIKIPIHEDIMVMGTAYELAEKHALEEMAHRYLGASSWDIPLKEKVKPNSKKVEKYLGEDLEKPWQLFRYFKSKMNTIQEKIYKKILMKEYLFYRKVEQNGIYLDQEGLEETRVKYKKKQKIALKKLKSQHDINWNSPKQVQDALYNKEDLPVLKLSKKTGNPSADASTLRKLKAKGHKIAGELLDYKFYFGANSKFLNKWGDYASYDGRIHPSFNITNVITGRTSCSNPNLQQVPRNPELRNLFIAPEGRSLLEADYSQIELRIAADYANEPEMLRIYREGGDIHSETGASVSGVSVKDLTKDQRTKAKAVNFGFLYGMSARGFITYAFDGYGVVFSITEAQRYRDLFFQKYSNLLPWHNEIIAICRANGGVENRFHQFRALPDIYSSSWKERSAAERRAINTPVQGTASILLTMAAYEIDKKLSREFDIKTVCTVHDSVIVDVPEEDIDEITVQMERIMRNPSILEEFNIKFKIPLEVDIQAGPWGS